MKFSLYALLLLVMAPLSGNGFAATQRTFTHLEEAWSASSDPRRMASDYIVKIDQLPQTGEAKDPLWSDYYWASHKGGVAYRWMTDTDGFRYSLNDLASLRQLSDRELSQLSPAEKYDLYRGDLSYSLVMSERRRTSPSEPRWTGLCDGWAAATLHFKEPKPVNLRSSLGFDIPFGAADVKALLALGQRNAAGANVAILGRRCSNGGTYSWHGERECRDVNAGSFHIALTNMLGVRREGLIFDAGRNGEIWNYPIASYSVRSLGEVPLYRHAAEGTVRILSVETTIQYVGGSDPSWNATGRGETTEMSLRYTVELDSQNNIIGGEWNQSWKPDFIWTQGPASFDGELDALAAIYRASIGE